jgi:hypothetical protein
MFEYKDEDKEPAFKVARRRSGGGGLMPMVNGLLRRRKDNWCVHV